MLARWLRVAATALCAAAAVPALAQESILDRPPDPEAWPTEFTRRPLTLGPGMVELTVPVDIDLTNTRAGKPVSIAPSVYYGVTSAFTIGVRHAKGLCLSGTGGGCRKAYDDVTLDALLGVARDVAVGIALTASPVSDPDLALSGEARVVARLASGPFALTVAPTLSVGFNERDAPGVVKTLPVSFPLASYSYGWYVEAPGNKEYLTIPVSLVAQLIPNVALSMGSAIHGPLYTSAAGDFTDTYRIPLGWAVVLTPERHFDVGASFTFTNLFGKDSGSDVRGLQVFASYRVL